VAATVLLRWSAKRYSRARPNTPVIARGQFAWRSILFRLKASSHSRDRGGGSEGDRVGSEASMRSDRRKSKA